MNNLKPIYDPTTHYRIKVQGRVDVECLPSFDGSALVMLDTTGQLAEVTLLNMHTDQSGFVGLVRRLHGLGLTILHVEIIAGEKLPAQIDRPC